MDRALPAVAILSWLFLVGCGPATFAGGSEQGLLPSPADVPVAVGHSPAEVWADGRLLFGAHYLAEGYNNRVIAVDHQLRFRPVWSGDGSDTLAEAAVALFTFEMGGYTGEAAVTCDWEEATVDPADCWLGLANYTTNQWDWCTAGSAPGEAAEYIDEGDRLVLVVVLLGEEVGHLNWVRVGAAEVVAGVDLTKLYASPLANELAAVEDDWKHRDTDPVDWTVVAERTDGDLFHHLVVSHEVGGETHYGYVRVPPYPGFHSFGVLVYCHGGSTGVFDTDLFNLDYVWIDSDNLPDQCIMVMPSFRGETVFGGELGGWTSDGVSDPYDTDCDDALALLNGVLDEFNSADPARIAVMGVSRGAQVAQRMGQRDGRIAAVVDCYGQTDEWLPSYQRGSAALLSQAGAGTDITGDPWGAVLDGMRLGSVDSWEARAFLLRRSTLYFPELYPRLQVHHGTADASISIEHSDRLAEVMTGYPEVGFEYYRYDGGTHNLTSLDDSEERIGALLEDVMGL